MAEQDDTANVVSPPAFYTPMFWPFLYVYKGIRLPENIGVPKPVSMSHLGFWDNILSFVASLRSFLMAYAVVYWLHDENNPYPAWGKGECYIVFGHRNIELFNFIYLCLYLYMLYLDI